MSRIYPTATFVLASIGMIALGSERASGAPQTAVSSGAWFSDWDAPPVLAGVAAAGATATAGSDLRRVGGTTVTDPQAAGTYAAGGATDPFATLGPIGGSTATTLSWVIPVKFNAATNTYNYRMNSFASVGITSLFGPSAQSSATANDPQFVATPGIFGETLGLASGAQLATDASTPSSASLHFEYDALNILSSPIASIDLFSSDGSASLATVSFNSDSRLQFFAPGTSTPITASDVATILNSSSVKSQLASSGGLSSDLALFDYTIDLTGTPLAPGQAFGSNELAQAAAAPIPEPSSYAAMVGLLALGATAWRRRLKTA